MKTTIFSAPRRATPAPRQPGHNRELIDRVAVLGFASRSTQLLGWSELTSPAIFAPMKIDDLGASTNPAAAVEQGHALLAQAPWGAVKRLVLISDGEANEGHDRLLPMAEMCRNAYISITSIYIGNEDGGAGVSMLRAISKATVNGIHRTVGEVSALRQAVLHRPYRPHSRVAWTCYALDLSPSMSAPMGEGLSRIDAAISALHSMAAIQRGLYEGPAVARGF